MSCSLIIPIMRQIDNNGVPHEVMLGASGKFNFYLDTEQLMFSDLFSDIYIVYNAELEKWIKNPLNDYSAIANKLHFVPISYITKSEPETISYVINSYNISGPIFIKDSDHYFELQKLNSLSGNAIVVYSLEDMETPIIPKTYSYVNMDDNMLITNTIEKRIISNMFNCGGYLFEDANDFLEAYNELCATENKLYISHLIYYLMLNKSKQFKGIKAYIYLE